MRRRSAWGLAIGVGLLLAACQRGAGSGGCTLWEQCTFESPPYRFRVVDADTGQPLADVHALAEWIIFSNHGPGGPLMVLDAVSGADGVVQFPGWGPLPGPPEGLMPGQDPLITAFKSGYKTQIVPGYFRTEPEYTVLLQPFKGETEAWVKELDKAAWPPSGSKSDSQLLQFRIPYLNRRKRVRAQQDKVPQSYQRPGQIFWHLENSIRFLERGER